MFYWHILQLHISVCMLVNLRSTEPSALSILLQMQEPEADNADCAMQSISVLNRSIVLCCCDSLRSTEQQRFLMEILGSHQLLRQSSEAANRLRVYFEIVI